MAAPNHRYPRANGTDIVTVNGQLWNQLVTDLERLMRLTVAPPLFMADGPGGKLISLFIPQAKFYWGTPTVAWTPGTNTVNLQPCNGPEDNTATSGSPLDVYMQVPLDKAALWGPSDTTEPLGYYATGAKDNAGAAVFILIQNPFPRPTLQYQEVQNSSSDVTKPNYTADFMRAG